MIVLVSPEPWLKPVAEKSRGEFRASMF